MGRYWVVVAAQATPPSSRLARCSLAAREPCSRQSSSYNSSNSSSAAHSLVVAACQPARQRQRLLLLVALPAGPVLALCYA